jgi:iron complex outermembrane recepter protein
VTSLCLANCFAAESPPATSQGRQKNMEEIVVTAQKRAESLQDVPISISVLGGQQLDSTTAGGVQDSLARMPGVTFETNTQGHGTQVAVRGVSAAFSTVFGASPVAYYVDAVPFGFVRSAILPDPDIYDLDRIEVLRGPQGTLYGAGGAGGVVRVLTKDADLDSFDLKSRVNFSHTQAGGENGRIDGAINVPIVEGKLAARAMVSYKSMAGWIDKPTRRDSNDGEARNARLKLRAEPTENLSLGISAWISRSDQDALGWSHGGRFDSFPDVESQTSDFDVYGLTADYAFSSFALSSSSGYLDYTSSSVSTTTASGAVQSFIRPSARTFVQEFNLTSTLSGPWRWTAGAIYRDGVDRRWELNTSVGVPQEAEFSSESWAVFGELTREFFDGRVALTTGLRHFEDDVQVRELRRAVAVQPAQLTSRNSKHDATTPRVVLNWRATDHMMLYASYAEGFRSGGDQQPVVLTVAPNLPPFQPDLLKNYEIGAKGEIMDGLLSYDAAVYFIDWKDVQLPLALEVDGLVRALLTNGAAADGPGAEFGLTLRPADRLVLGATFSWNDLTVTKDVLAGPSSSVLAYPEGTRLNSSAEYTAGASADYSFPLGANGYIGRFLASANYSSRRAIRLYLGGTTVLNTQSDPLLFGNMSFAVEAPEHWTASLYVDNVGNEDGISNAFIFQATPTTPARSMHPRPRTYGLQLEYRY